MSDDDSVQQRIWNLYTATDGTWRRTNGTAAARRPPGEDLAVLRRGLGSPAGEVLEMFPFYTCPPDDFAAARGEMSDAQQAEHVALALYGLHQQGQERPMHRGGVGLGRALQKLRLHERSSADAVDRRFQQAFSATSLPALAWRLRGLVTQLRAISQPLDYDRLTEDLYAWRHPQARGRVRRRWGLDYYSWQWSRPRPGRADS